jgi:dipeptidyl aminopeptidase/acylaminoacyl peptidase
MTGTKIALLFAAGSTFAIATAELPAHRPSPAEMAEAYQRSERIGRDYESRAFKVRLQANWIDNGTRLWYRNNLANDVKEFILVDSATGKKSPAFDHARLATALSTTLGRPVEGTKLPFNEIDFLKDGGIYFETGNQAYRLDTKDYAVAKTEMKPRRQPQREGPWRQDLWSPRRDPLRSPDGKATTWVADHNVRVKVGDEEMTLTNTGSEKAYFSRLVWSPDSKRVIATRVTPGDRKLVHLVESSPKDEHRAQLQSRVYDQPGDKVDTFDLWIIDVEKKAANQIKADRIEYGGIPYLRWRKDNRNFTYDQMDRGYGRWRIVQVDSVTGESKTIVDDDPDTFVDSTAQFTQFIDGTDEVIWRSERDGWGHLYLTDKDGKLVNQITKGPWVVREVTRVDEKARQITFGASGMNKGEDPYFVHYYRIGFDGKGLTPLSPAPGQHSLQWSPNQEFYVDTYSAVDKEPVHELRRAKDGGLVATLEKADISALKSFGWKAPQVFVSKARDGKTDIWGIVYRPSNFDPSKRYPVIEDIYAGPQDSFVPKTFAASRGLQSLAELGFIVVKIDGLGTRNRGKAFHDVCYKNIADAGLPDRILWMKDLASKDPAVDVSRVGIFGGSAGGQNSTGALLFHPDFYKVAVSSCGCHDNRIDKIWWNEQWMGVIGPHYEAQSNITNAAKLQGKLMLVVGELDSNVPPESTYRLADALIKARKDFELVMLPGEGHTGGGAYGERKRRDFFVRHLIGVEPPAWR